MRYLVIFISIIMLFFACTKDEPKAQEGDCIPFYYSDTYMFPIVPGTDVWKKLNSLAEMVEVCQIPNEKLKSISTEGLLETLLSYPLVLDYHLFEHMQRGFTRIKTENNGFAELYSRSNVYDVMSKRYELMSLVCNKNIYPPKFDGEYAPISISTQLFELFLFQNDLLDNINEKQKRRIFDLVYLKHQQKKELNFYPRANLVSEAIMGKIMYELDYKPFVDICKEIEFIQFFIEEIPIYRPANFDPTDIIEEHADKFKIQ